MRAPDAPRRPRRSDSAARSPTVRTPSAASRRRVAGPTPQRRSTGSGWRNSSSVPGATTSDTVGLGEIAGELGEQLRGRDADRRREPGLGAHAPPDRRPRTRRPAPWMRDDAADVEERLVGRDRLDERRERTEDRHHLAALLAVAVEARREEHAVGTRAPRPRHRHRRVHAEAARLVARGGDDTARAEAADDHRLPDERRILELLHRRVERVEVDVQDRRIARGQPGRPVDVRTTRSSSRVVAEHVVGVRPVLRAGPTVASSQSSSGSRTHARARVEQRRPTPSGPVNAASTTMPSGSSTCSVALERERAVHLAPQRPPEPEGDGAHLVQRAFPLGDDRARSPPRPRGRARRGAWRRSRRSRRRACSTPSRRCGDGSGRAAARRRTRRAHRPR